MNDAVIINGVVYVPETAEEKQFDAKVKKLLCDVDRSLWIEAHYDGFNDATVKFATPLYAKMSALNEILKFRR